MRVLVLLFLFTACARSEPGERELLSGAEDATRTFFAHGEAGDCKQLAPMLQRPETCDVLVKQFLETHTHLSKIVSTKVDGRDKHMALVSVEAVAPGHVHQWIVRAKWTPDGWKMAL